jgi:cytochrome subunit of sulfide dehydrogenase
MRAAILAVIGAAVAMLAPPAAAQNADPQLLTRTCAGCHGPDGRGFTPIPSIAGRSAGSLKETLLAFRSGSRPSTVMGRLAKGYSDAEIEAVAGDIALNWK